MKISILVLLFVLMMGSHCLSLPIQAHSFNDLDYLSNLIDKGINYFKLDVSMASKQSCKANSNWSGSQKCLNTSQYVEEICCLAMRGDASSTPNFNYPFNLSSEFISLLSNKMDSIKSQNRTLLFAINFQYAHQFTDFISETFMLNLAILLQQYPHNLLIGTGSDSFILEYDRICFGKGSPECSMDRRKISESSIFLQSSSYNPVDPRDHKKRFRNFNVMFKEIDRFCRDGFPSWIQKYPQFPLIFWQPSNERQIQYVLEKFLSPTCVKKHQRSLSGMAIATNIDSEMFQIYSKRLVSMNLQEQESSLKKIFSYLPFKQQISSLLQTIGFKQQQVKQEFTWDQYHNKVFLKNQKNLKMQKVSHNNEELLITIATDQYSKAIALSSFRKTPENSIQLLLSKKYSQLLSNQEEITEFLVDNTTQNLILICSVNIKGKLSSKIYYLSSFTFEVLTMKEWEYVSAATMRSNELIYIFEDVTGSNRTYIKGMKQFKQVKNYSDFKISLFMKQITGIEFIDEYYLVVGDSVTQGLAVLMFIQDGQLIAPERPLAYGTNPKIIKKQNGKQFIVTLENSMCSSALLINNNDMNKCTYHKEPEFASLKNIRGMINILEFDFNSVSKNQQILTPCTKNIKMSKLMNGYSPSVVELSTWNAYIIGTSYLKVEQQDMLGALFCGGSNFDYEYATLSGSMMASFLA